MQADRVGNNPVYIRSLLKRYVHKADDRMQLAKVLQQMLNLDVNARATAKDLMVMTWLQ